MNIIQKDMPVTSVSERRKEATYKSSVVVTAGRNADNNIEGIEYISFISRDSKQPQVHDTIHVLLFWGDNERDIKDLFEAAFDAGNVRGSEATMNSDILSADLPPDFETWWKEFGR